MLLTCSLAPQEPVRLPVLVVESRPDRLVGTADSASAGLVTADELRRRPLLRPAEVLEAVPGVVVTQHSGSGKSNQLFARGFNLDHGTDLATSLFGVPMNMPSHGHGQGYTDLNPLIPELVDSVGWRLGPYDVRDGDFASAGAIDIDYVRRLPGSFVKFGGGTYGHGRIVAADSRTVGAGTLLAAVELQRTDGPFDVSQDYDKRNVYVSWSTDELRVAGFLHAAEWTSTDQIPRRAVLDGSLGRFSSLDRSAGGNTAWYGTVLEWKPPVDAGSLKVTGYLFHYELDLWSNFTYAQNDPVNGDQIEQLDRRTTFGYEASRTWDLATDRLPSSLTLGSELRSDAVHNGLFASRTRQRLGTVRRDRIGQNSLAVWGDVHVEPTEWLRGHVGLRGDQYWFDVAGDNASNSGKADDSIASTKTGIALGPWADTEVYGNFGTGFHSNDARGVLLRDDPATATPNDGSAVAPLVRSRGAELGVRTSVVPGLQSTIALWGLDLASELVFVGDAGTTEPNRASRRAGIEFANDWRPLSWLTIDADVTTSRARYRGDNGGSGGDRIPGTVPLTVVGGISIDWSDALSTGLRLRHLGNRPLTEDGSVQSTSTTLVNARATWRLDAQREFTLDVLNLFDRRDSDIEYFYASQRPGEAQPSDDVHFHPVEPLTVRLSFTARF